MVNSEFLEDELYSVNSELDGIVDQMIERYGKFISISDVDSADRYQTDLVRNFAALQKQKDYLIDELQVNQK